MSQLEIQTSLGPPLLKISEGNWEIDLSSLRIFFGLSILSRSLAEEIGNQLHSAPGDVSFLYKINPSINHELTDMHIQHVQVYARAGVLNDWILYRSQFEDDLRIVLGTFQRQSIARKLHPEFYGEDARTNPSVGLLFPFYEIDKETTVNYQILLERVTSLSHSGEFFLRITIDSNTDSTLDLLKINHERVDEIGRRTYIAGLSKISESLANSILSAAQKGETFFEEENRHFNKVFEQIEKTPFGRLTNINFYWEDQFRQILLASSIENALPLMKKLFLILEDTDIANVIKDGNTVLAKLGRSEVYIDLSRLDRVLNFSFNKRRTQIDSSFYLKRMILLEQIANSNNHKFSFEGINIFLIHHITSEIISLIETFRRLKAKSIDVAFVKYGGNIPPIYLDVLLDIPTEQFYMAGLEFKLTKNNKAYYGVSPLYSDFAKHNKFKEKLEEAKFGFYDAMRYLATFLFLNKLFFLKSPSEKFLLIEDGGYIAPILNQRCLENKSLLEYCEEFWIECPIEFQNLSLKEFILSRVIGTVEHTRNGFDRLLKVSGESNILALTAYSIAISKEKSKEESKEVAYSILNAIENTLHGLGKVISKRKIMLLGSHGNIGTFLDKYLIGGRLHESNLDLIRVDLKILSNEPFLYKAFTDVDNEEFLNVDLIIGVTGDSVLKQKNFENWILNSKKPHLFLVSGSTKTVEFSDFIDWMNQLNSTTQPMIGSDIVKLEISRILDPQTQMDLGGKIHFEFQYQDQMIEKSIYLLSDGSPINFLFFGVPTESMDPIISQLTSTALGMVHQFKNNNLPSPKLYAVDHQINQWGESI
ncbi:MAG: hypothetical protein SH817_02475 [Leptospira sp.]|nr:hypothetical protein [Leptospira sp.]